MTEKPCWETYREAGWVFRYDEYTGDISMSHPLGGTHDLCWVEGVLRDGWNADELGNSIAAMLNGKGQA